MTDTRFDVLCIGNAIVDILARADDDFLVREGVTKGMMRLIEAEDAERIYAAMGPAVETSGGSAGNTAAGIGSFGARAAYIGKVADDRLGDSFAHDMKALGIHFATGRLVGGAPTARCFVLITPDGERTMNTYLGACRELSSADIDPAVVSAAEITYLEGYLWDPPAAKEAFRKASQIAHAAGRRVALTLSDSFCVDRFRPEFLDLVRSGTVDIVFANETELKALYETSDRGTALDLLARDAALAAVTLGEEGAIVLEGAARHRAPAGEVERIDDLTGAGDQFAAGFMVGLTRGLDLTTAARLGCMAAAEVIQHIGPRPAVRLVDLAAEQGIALGAPARKTA